MADTNTHFEQIPLEIVHEILRNQNSEQEIPTQNKTVPAAEQSALIGRIAGGARSAKLDIFHRETGDSLIWRGTANDLHDAKLQVRALAAKAPGEYILVNLENGSRFLLKG